ncbi:MFS transporter [Candidatus Microgenomates bacterium]|nr:MFS transporter [Candidatus Microgenomates bacterium]
MLKSINKVVKILVLSDFTLLFGWGLVAPILAIFITGQIQGGDARVAGIAIGIYWLLKSLLQIPIGRYLDQNHGEKDDYYFLIIGTLLVALPPLGFIFATLPWHMYALQGLHAIGAALSLPAWCGIFTRHIGKGREAQSWALDSSALGIGAGISGIIGGIIAKSFGFTPLFIGVSVFAVISALLCILIKKDLIIPKKKEVILIPKPK